MTGLKRSLGLLDATLVNVGVMIGSAVFLTAPDVARLLPSPMLQLAAWAVAGLFSLAGALTIAELGTSFPHTGGLTVYLREAFGPFWGFLYGWALFVVIQTAANAAVAVAFAGYFAHFWALPVELVAVLAIAVFTVINVIGVREGVFTQNLTSFAKLAVMAGLVAMAFVSPAHAPSAAAAVSSPGIGAFGAALIGPLFAVDGWITLSYMGGEVRNPSRVLPLAAMASVAIVTAVYLALNGAYLWVLGSDGVARSTLVAADTAQALLGPRGADFAAAMVMVATLGGLNGNILGGARVFYALSAEGLFWRGIGKVHPRFGTPAAALYLQGSISIAFVFTGRFDQLITATLFASWLFYGLGGLAVFVLRRRTDLERPYQVPGHPWVTALFVIFAAALLVSTIAADPRDSALGAGLLATGVPAFFAFRYFRTRSPVPMAGPGPS